MFIAAGDREEGSKGPASTSPVGKFKKSELFLKFKQKYVEYLGLIFYLLCFKLTASVLRFVLLERNCVSPVTLQL